MIRLAILFFIFLLAGCIRVGAEPAVRLNVALTCADIQALVAWRGWDDIERRARAAGATDEQIRRAKACVK